jgi:cytochrome P450
MIPDIDPLDLVDPERFAQSGYLHVVWTRLRAEAPVAQLAPPGFRPFWAITKHADVAEISSQPQRFSSDEEVFEDPFAFRVDRHPNRHLAFGIGEHVCLGAHLARVELETIFRHLLARLEWFEVSGPVERLRSVVNGGIKRLPLCYRLR